MSGYSRATHVCEQHCTFKMGRGMLTQGPDYVMSLAINPKDTNTFASACLDRTGMPPSTDTSPDASLIPLQSRFGAWDPPRPTSSWKLMRQRESTMSIIILIATSLTCSPPQTTYAAAPSVSALLADQLLQRTVKVWDYTTKSLIATLEGHTNNVSFACYHPELPIIISGSEDVCVCPRGDMSRLAANCDPRAP